MAQYNWQGLIHPQLPQLPHVQDVGAPKTPPIDTNKQFTYWVGTDGSLWRTKITGDREPTQVRSPGTLTRVAVSPRLLVHCVDRYGKVWILYDNGDWWQVDIPGETIIDVDVGMDDSVWYVANNGRYYVWRNDAARPQYIGILLNFSCITGVAQPNLGQANYGNAWGISEMIGRNGLIGCDRVWQPGVATIQDLADLSVTTGILWMVHTDGTVWTTSDGRLQERKGGLIARRVAACFSGIAYATGIDGRAWTWIQEVAPQPPPPTPTLPPPPPESPGAEAPVISVSVSGAGESTVFRVTGHKFRPNAQVNIRVVRLGAGQVFENYWITSSTGTETLIYDISLPCVSGLVFHFSANDGRVNTADHISTLWSNTVTASCP
jgi:hypothetical protein